MRSWAGRRTRIVGCGGGGGPRVGNCAQKEGAARGAREGNGRDEVLEHLSTLVRDANYRTRLGATLGLGELGYPKAEDELQRIADAEPMSNLRTNARKAIASLREKHAEAAKKVEQQEELDKLKDENKELRSRITAIEARIDAIGKKRKR